MAKDRRDDTTRDWVDEDDERRFKEEREMVRRKLRQEKFHEKHDSETPPPDRTRTRPPR